MGCDIHAVVEYRDPRSSNAYRREWGSLIKDFWEPRDYQLFGRLAGVRSSEVPVAPPRGFPADASGDTRERFMYWIAYGHEPGDNECSPEDAKRYHERYGCPYWGEYKPYGTVSSMQAVEAAGMEARLVFWFDN